MLYVILGGEIMGLILLLFASKNQSAIGLRSIAFMIYGYKTWRYSNRLGGIFLTALSTCYLVLYLLFHADFARWFQSYIALGILLILLSDLLAIRHYRKKREMN